jgi:hypothetical protein
MNPRFAVALSLTALCFLPAAARPVLVAVDLETTPQARQWADLEYSTYELLGHTAIAEVDDANLPALRARGFRLSVIDEAPWSDPYFLCTVRPDLQRSMPGSVIWSRDGIQIITLARAMKHELLAMPMQFTEIKKRALPSRVIDELLLKKVPVTSLEWNAAIQAFVDEVNTDSLTAYIQRLQDFETRLILVDSSYAASAWLKGTLESWGYAAEFDSFWVNADIIGDWPGTGWERNVIATQEGTLNPSSHYVIGGHFDSIVWDPDIGSESAPGADDNASGTAAALEAARIFKDNPLEPTVHFACWAAEEVGLVGSEFWAESADNLDWDIKGVLNNDMIGYMDDGSLDCIIQRKDAVSFWLADLFEKVGALYVPSLDIRNVLSGGGSDWYPFAVLGYPSVGAAERAGTNFNPHYHSTHDTLGTMTPELYTAITKVNIAMLALLGFSPQQVADVAVQDLGDGDGLLLTWEPNPEADVIGYTVLWGTETETYTESLFVDGAQAATLTITDLETDSTYYFVVRAADADGFESYLATEVSGAPQLVPRAPEGLVATPLEQTIHVSWQENIETDLAGYRVFRRMNEESGYEMLTEDMIAETSFTDEILSGSNRYYYAVRAYDLDENESDFSEEAYGRPITLDQGIVIVDETRDFPSTPDEDVDEFYRFILDGYRYEEHEFGFPDEAPILADLGPYSTVVWHADDYSDLMASASVDAIESYLDAGGKLWFTGWKPTSGLTGDVLYPIEFAPGDFVYDYLRMERVDLSSIEDAIIGFDGLEGFPPLMVNPDKIPVPSWGGSLRYVEAITALPEADAIYTIDVEDDENPFEGSTCSIRYLGSDYQVVFFGFPLYFMDQDQARAAAQSVMSGFGELSSDNEPAGGTRITRLTLNQNSPNPFDRETSISYAIPNGTTVRLQVFDLSGRLIATLVDAPQAAGYHTAKWNGENEQGQSVSNGVYFYRIEAEEGNRMRRMLLVR